jgi:hypothetical protein
MFINAKTLSIKITAGMGEGEIKGKGRGCEFMYDIFYML